MFEIFNSLPTIIACLAIGLVLIVIEALTPGLGLPGLTGTGLLFFGSVLIWCRYGLTPGLIALFVSLLLTFAAVLFSLKSATSGKLSKTGIMLEENTAEPETKDESELIGKCGTTVTPLNPVGTVLLECRRIDVFSDGGFIPKDCNVTVTRADGSKVYVAKID